MTEVVQAVVGSMVVVGALIHSVCDLKAAQMNVKCSLI